LAFCFLLNKEYMRCINLIEKNELTLAAEKFRLLVAEAHMQAGNV